MDLMPLHPKFVHLPIALAVLMPLVSAGLLVAWLKDLLPRRAWIVAVALQALLVVSSVAAMRTGENDEEVAERVVAESAIEAHEEAAELFTWTAAGALLVFVAASLLPEAAARAAATAATAASLLVLLFGYRVGDAGGSLVYQHNAGAAYAIASASGGGGDKGVAAHAGPRGGEEQEEEEDDD